MKVHFIGIGGIGISAIARMFLAEGKTVTGSDQSLSPITEELAKLGAKISIGHKAENITPDVNLVVYTIAVTPDNPELVMAKKLNITALSYPQMLGKVSAEKYTIAVSGTHGKTTTTAMLAKIFIDAGLEPTVIVGSLLKDIKSNFIAGQGKYFITEACEYRRSFLNLNPKIVVITNIDNDHLDYYKDLADIQSAFAELVAKIPADGFLVCDAKALELAPVLKSAKCKVVDYTSMTREFSLQLPGEHNIRDAQAALAAAETQAIPFAIARRALESFGGTWRRFEKKGTIKTGALVYDDYGHHPTEVKATLSGARDQVRGKLFAVFQPHLYSRTKLLLNDFATSFKDADEAIILPIYAAREPFDPTINSGDLVKAIAATGKSVQGMNSFEEVAEYLKEAAKAGDMIITIGAGDVFKIAESLVV